VVVGIGLLGCVVVFGLVVVAGFVDVGGGVVARVVVAGAGADTTGAGVATGGEVACDLAARDFFEVLDALWVLAALCFLAFLAGSLAL
jgi:hypothetical protein